MAAKFSLLTIAALPLIPIALACGGDDGGGKITVRPDGPSGGGDTGPAACTGAASYGDALAQAAGSDGMMGGTGSDAYTVFWIGRMDNNTNSDILQIALIEGAGPFASGITPQTIQLTGNQIDATACDACVIMFTDYNFDDDTYADLYFATGGTLDLTSVSDTFEGTLSNLTMTHIVQAGNSIVAANDGCDSTFSTINMGSAIMPQEGSATGKPAASGTRFKLPHRFY
jgi:hypothetical protein